MQRRSLHISLLLVATLTAWIAAPTDAHAASAIDGSNRPVALTGLTNGELPASALIRVTSNCQTARAAGPSMYLMLREAQSRNIAVSTTECYRPLSGQVQAQQSWTNAGNSACAAAPTTSGGKVVGTSMHGWGKAADLFFGGPTFNSAGYRFLKDRAGAYGWNHPSWAEPGGSSCPEAWHWEWVGDGGTNHADPVVADVIGFAPSADEHGYRTFTGLGAVHTFGNATTKGDALALPLNWVMVGGANTPGSQGYWMVGADGGIFSFGDAAFYGSTGSMRLNKPVVGMAATPSGHGYWLVAADGGIFSYGDAAFYGSTGSMRLNKPVVGMAPTPSGHGYWLVAADGGIFSFGDAAFYGSTGSMALNSPVVGATSTASGHGYWLVAADGGIFSFGDAAFYGSAGGNPPAQPVTSITRTTTGAGYWITAANGEVFAYGNAQHFAAN